MESKLEKANWVKIRFKQLNLICEKSLDAICHRQLYHQRMTKSYDKKVRLMVFEEGDLLLRKILTLPGKDQSKWASNYEGPYVVKKTFSREALLLTRMDGDDFPRPVNFDSVRKYYA